MSRLRKITVENVNYYSLLKHYRNGKRTTKTLITIGNDKKARKYINYFLIKLY